jgi:hypothetical protein
MKPTLSLTYSLLLIALLATSAGFAQDSPPAPPRVGCEYISYTDPFHPNATPFSPYVVAFVITYDRSIDGFAATLTFTDELGATETMTQAASVSVIYALPFVSFVSFRFDTGTATVKQFTARAFRLQDMSVTVTNP